MGTLDAFAAGKLAPMPQDSQSATHAKKLSKTEGVFDPQLSSELALAQIHGLDPWPRCSASIGSGSCSGSSAWEDGSVWP